MARSSARSTPTSSTCAAAKGPIPRNASRSIPSARRRERSSSPWRARMARRLRTPASGSDVGSPAGGGPAVILYLRSLDRWGLRSGACATLVLGAGIIFGSGNLRNYDPVLLTYTFGVLFSVFAVAYRIAVWIQRPPTRRVLGRGLALVRQGNVPGNLAFLFRAATVTLGAQ